MFLMFDHHFPRKTAMNIPKREDKYSPMCGQPPSIRCLVMYPSIPLQYAGLSGKTWVPSSLNSSFPDTVNWQFRSIPPVSDTPIYYVFRKIPDSMIIIYIYIPSFVDHFSLFGWFNTLFVSGFLDLPDKNRQVAAILGAWAHYCYQEQLDEAAFGANDRPRFFLDHRLDDDGW